MAAVRYVLDGQVHQVRTGSASLGRSFRSVWTASATANLGDGILLVGFPLLAVQLTRSPFLVSLVSMLATLPWLLVALPAGALADRRDRRRILLGAMALRVVTLVGLAACAWAGVLTLPVVYVGVALLGTAEVFADTTTQSILPMLVRRDRLGAANGRIIAAQTVTNDFLGGPAAGFLIAAGATYMLGAPAILYGLAALLVARLRGGFVPPARAASPMRVDIVEGVRYLAAHRIVRALAGVAGLVNFAAAAYMAVFVLWAVGPGSAVGLTPTGYGIVMAALAVGGIGAALITERLTARLGEPRTLWVAVLVIGPLFLMTVWFPRPAIIGVSYVAIGAAAAITKVVSAALAQRLIPDELLGRVNATSRLIVLGTMPIGAVLGGTVGSLFGLPPVFYGAAVLCLVAAAMAASQVTPEQVTAAEDRVGGSST